MSEAAANRIPAVERIPQFRLWLACTLLLLALAIALTGYLFLRHPIEVIRPGPMVEVPLAPDVAARARQLEELNRSLEEQIEKLGSVPPALACAPGTERRVQNGGIVPPVSGTPPVEAVTAPETGVAEEVATPDLLQRLERATALVISGSSIATGFFISDDLLVTNRHAIESADDGKVLIASRSLGEVQSATVIGASSKGEVGQIDVALVRLDHGRAPGVLPVTTSYKKLTGVVAAGYPGLTVVNDAGFRKLIAGDAKAAPDLNVTQGAVQSIQQLSTGTAAIAHTASILQGNSGGPLVDQCGRVIGVNTFIAVDQQQSGRISFAQPSDTVLTFLKSHGIAPTLDGRACPK